MRILVVEDDKALGAFLRQGLELEGHAVSWVEDGDAALDAIADISPELIVLDLSLPKRDGIEVLGELRMRRHDSSVLVLTGRNDLDARVHCLDIGADDCMLKPFSYFELMARCRALLRRRRNADPVLRHGNLELHRIEHRVARAGKTVALTAKEFGLLEYLMLHKGDCISRGRLLADVWQMPAEAGTNVVDVYVNYLRRKLDSDGDGSAPLIETVRGAGYRLGGPARDPAAHALRASA